MNFNFFKSTVLFVLILGVSNASVRGQIHPEQGLKPAESSEKILMGAERFSEYLPWLEGKRVGIVGNQTSVVTTPEGRVHLVDTLLGLGVDLRKVFAPEHGFRGTADAGEVVKDGKDPATGLPVISLYGDNKKPSAEQLAELDVLLFDIQDVGARFYTYISTLHYVMEAAAENNIPLIVLDRPNPNGSYIDGPVLEPAYQSFVGMHEVPVVHGMTIGEYAMMINGQQWLPDHLKTDLYVVRMENYDHSRPYDLPVKPSPNLPNAQSIMLYPSLCFFEGTNVNAGRGTALQFQVYGSPDLPSDSYSYSYVPESREGAKNPKHLGTRCYGENLSELAPLNELRLDWLIRAFRSTSDPDGFFNDFFTKLAGTDQLQKQIEAGMSPEEIRSTWKEGLAAYDEMRSQYLLYN